MLTLNDLKELKKRTGLTCEQIAKESGVPLGTVQKVFAGTTKNPRYETLRALEDGFARLIPREEKHPNVQGDIQKGRASAERPAVTGSKGGYEILRDVSYVADSAAAYKVGGRNDDGNGEGKGSYRDNPLQHHRKGQPYDRQGTYTLEDYLALPDDQRVELIDGSFYDMSSPYMIHQAIIILLSLKFEDFIEKNGGPCVVLPAPADVQLDKDDRTILEPDICIVCDPKKVHKERIYGAPDLVVEVLSQSTKEKDLTTKYWKYHHAKVREYWVIDPDKLKVTVFDFAHDLDIETYTFHDVVPVGIYNGKLKINFEDILKQLQNRYGLAEK